MSDAARFEKEYEAALRAYASGAGEEELQHAYQLGRAALSDGLGILDVAAMHGRAFGAMARASLTEKVTARASAFLVESLAPFEMSLRGTKEAHEHIVLLNARLARQRP